jgi:Uncharacterised protein family (UPF0175)
VRIPDDLARRLGTVDEIERRALEALALEELKLSRLTKRELRRLLGFGTRMKHDEFLKAHDVYEPYTLDNLERGGRPGRDCARRRKSPAPVVPPPISLPGARAYPSAGSPSRT